MYRTAEKWDKAEAVYQEIIDESGVAEGARIKLALAQMHQVLQNEKKMEALLKELARARVVERGGVEIYLSSVPPGGIVGPPEPLIDRETSNTARGMLAGYCYAKGNWKEALRWYEAWEPSSWCGTGQEARKAFKAGRIATCREKLGLKP